MTKPQERSLAVAVKMLLLRKGKNQDWLAERMGVSRPTVSHRLGTEKGPLEDWVRQMALVLGLTYEELIQSALDVQAEAAKEGVTLADPIVRVAHVPWVSDKLKAKLGID